MYSKLKKSLLLVLLLSLNAYGDFYEQIEDMDKKRDINYKELNATIKKPNTDVYMQRVQKAMVGLKERVDSYEKNVYGGATKKDILKNLQSNKTIGGSETDIDLIDNDFIQKNRIYVFMSSSVPLSIWHEYGSFIYDNKLKNGSLLLRGCINGCKKIKPTLDFMEKVIKYNPKKIINPSILLDPLVFKRYGIKEVPCVVYAKGVDVNRGFDGSEGSKENVKTKEIYKSCGDWNMMYHLEEIQKKSKDSELAKIIKNIKDKK